MVLGTWSPNCFATTPPIVCHYRASSTTHGCAPTPAGSYPPSAPPRNPEPTWPARLPPTEGCFICPPRDSRASMFRFHCHRLQTAIILAHFMMGILCTHFFILYSVMSLSMSSMFPRGVCFYRTFFLWNILLNGHSSVMDFRICRCWHQSTAVRLPQAKYIYK